LLTGALLFFNRFLLLTGNILFFPGVTLAIGLDDTLSMLYRNKRGALGLGLGFILIWLDWEMLGFFLQAYAIFVLFLPTVLTVSYDACGQIPYVGPILENKWVKRLILNEDKKKQPASIPYVGPILENKWVKRLILNEDKKK